LENFCNGFQILTMETSGCFEKFLQWLTVCIVGERERRTCPHEKQIQIAFQETDFQSHFRWDS
jgi:hypothetical protein